MALCLSLLSASKVLYEFKVFLRHNDRTQKLLGKLDYDGTDGDIKESVRTFVKKYYYFVSFFNNIIMIFI